MESTFAIPGAVALVEWLLAAALYTFGWYQTKTNADQVADSLALAGLVTALAGVAWLTWDVAANLWLARSSLATELAVSMLAIQLLLSRRRTERLSTLLILAFAIPVQAYAVARLWWQIEVVPSSTGLLPFWAVFRTLTGVVGYASLATCAALIILSYILARMKNKVSGDRLTAAAGLPALEWRSCQIALIALSISLWVGLIRSWWGLGQVMVAGSSWALVSWLLLVAGTYGLVQGAFPRRLARALVVLAGAVGLAAVLMLAGTA
jgi:hypothetical protein